MRMKFVGFSESDTLFETRAAIGTAETPAEPMSGLTSPLVADDGRVRVFVTFRDAERFVSDGAGTYPPPQAPEGIARWGARRAKRCGRGAVTGETAMGINRFDS